MEITSSYPSCIVVQVSYVLSRRDKEHSKGEGSVSATNSCSSV